MWRCQLISSLIVMMVVVTCRSLNCFDGFTGIVQHTIEDDFTPTNETFSPVCTSTWCVKVLIYDGHSD
uniref:Secreted protein n=1 Tax=Plectus sambesii TaxID=2011161 RepID=A0A914WIW6_9BILA